MGVYLIYFIHVHIFLFILYKCVHCQDNVVSQITQTDRSQQSQPLDHQQTEKLETKEIQKTFETNNEPTKEAVDVADTLEGNVLKENPVEKLNELSRDISKEINQNPYYKLPEMTRKIREIAILHPDLMEKLGVYVIPIKEEPEEHEDQGEEHSEMVNEESKEGKDEQMRSEIDELMEMIKAMTPEEKLEYIPQLKETIVYQILKNNELLNDLYNQMGYNHRDFNSQGNPPEFQNYQQYQNYPGYEYYQNPQGYGYQYYPNYGSYQGYGYYPGGQYYQNYTGYGY